jgi:hypothetical protein
MAYRVGDQITSAWRRLRNVILIGEISWIKRAKQKLEMVHSPPLTYFLKKIGRTKKIAIQAAFASDGLMKDNPMEMIKIVSVIRPLTRN